MVHKEPATKRIEVSIGTKVVQKDLPWSQTKSIVYSFKSIRTCPKARPKKIEVQVVHKDLPWSQTALKARPRQVHKDLP